MITTLKNVLRPYKRKAAALYHKVVPKQPDGYRPSYSQEGEDMILARIFENRKSGFFVDIGAFHPQCLSNTYYFYLQGWQGINLDAMPGSMAAFNQLRPKDINLEIPISDSKQVLTYYSFNLSNFNGFSKELSAERDGITVGDGTEVKVVSETELETSTLAEVLDQYLPNTQSIDFINVDVEGLDYQVLKSNDWQKYRPKVVLVEDLDITSINRNTSSAIANFMYSQGYDLYAKTVYTLIFKQQDFKV
ncbi:MAG: FkbM family methyltransferase [Trichocoleus desertorum ATA4-8-CV12]|jgi:FkbM family methyltransferase|nr:FkbM family methyltransferase [Trichocoleus desertorum ATA4-8-CV12]